MSNASISTMSVKTLIKYRIFPILLALLSSISLTAVVSVDSICSGSFFERFGFDTIAERYNPERSDLVKVTYHAESSEEPITYFIDAWLPIFLRHPDVYIESFLNGTYGYIYSFSNCGDDTSRTGFMFTISVTQATDDCCIHFLFKDNIREKAYKYAYASQVIPGLAQLMNPGTYTLVLLICAGYLCRKGRWKDLLVLANSVLSIAVCVASPVNGYLRYALSYLACKPLTICWYIGRFGPDGTDPGKEELSLEPEALQEALPEARDIKDNQYFNEESVDAAASDEKLMSEGDAGSAAVNTPEDVAEIAWECP